VLTSETALIVTFFTKNFCFFANLMYYCIGNAGGSTIL